jgi:hypothetical protein
MKDQLVSTEKKYKDQFSVVEDVALRGMTDISRGVGDTLTDIKGKTDQFYTKSGSINTGSREKKKSMYIDRTVSAGERKQDELSLTKSVKEKQLGQQMSDDMQNINLSIEDLENQLEYLRDHDEFHENLFG